MGTPHGFSVHRFPSSRLFTIDIGKLGMRRHHVKALVEIDITGSRKRIRELRREAGRAVSFTSWTLACIGRALGEHKQVHAFRKGKYGLVVFDEVDVTIIVEKDVGGVRVPLPLVIRNVNGKSIEEIHGEIDAAKKRTIDGEGEFVLGREKSSAPTRLFAMLPRALRLLLWRILLSDPRRVKKMMGTAIVTSVGMMGQADGWIIPHSIHPVCFAIGSISTRPGMSGGEAAPRDYVKMTILVDHDVVDGAPAARFVGRLTELMESGFGL